MHSFRGIVDIPRRRFVSSLFAGALILLFAWLGCQSRPPAGPGDGGGDCTPGQPCGGGVDPGDPDDGDGLTLDSCAGAGALSGAATYPFDNASATLDGPPHAGCADQGLDQVDRDVWMCWTSDCDGLVVVETCGLTQLDTRLAVYEGCDCPATSARLLDCSDDDCSVQTRVTFQALAGEHYLIRVGVFPGTEAGIGSVAISCGFDACPGAGDCASEHAGGGCEDGGCCNEVCRVDSVCCTGAWDDQCVREAAALCNGGFDACGPTSGDCTTARSTPGCGDSACCNAVCEIDTYCCLEEWDAECVTIEARTCFGACSASDEECNAAHAGPGCKDPACCAEVCPRDPNCCLMEWAAACVELADEYCTDN